MRADNTTTNNNSMILFECNFIICQFCVFVHGNMFAVTFKIFKNVIHRNVMSVFISLYVSMLIIVR